MRGDWIEVVIDAGDHARTYRIAATRAGRRVDVSTSRQVIEVTEVTRTGNPVRTARFMAARVLALVEHPAGAASDDAASGRGKRAEPAPGPRRTPGEENEESSPGPRRPQDFEW